LGRSLIDALKTGQNWCFEGFGSLWQRENWSKPENGQALKAFLTCKSAFNSIK
jgi:hypothetical protein